MKTFKYLSFDLSTLSDIYIMFRAIGRTMVKFSRVPTSLGAAGRRAACAGLATLLWLDKGGTKPHCYSEALSLAVNTSRYLCVQNKTVKHCLS